MTPEEANQIIEHIREQLVSGKIDLMEFIKPPQENNHEEFVTHMRLVRTVMTGDERIYRKLGERINTEIAAHIGEAYDPKKFSKPIDEKGGQISFAKLVEELNRNQAERSSLLAPGTFQECLDQFKRLIGHVEKLWEDACAHYRAGNFPMATFLAILAIEEIGKLVGIFEDLLRWDVPRPLNRPKLSPADRDHRRKHFVGVVSGALVNARLDRILGIARLKQCIDDAESGKLETLRQSCLYTDVVNGRMTTPDELVTQDTARFYCVLAGELWMETLGFFPWEFVEMRDKVSAFEENIGITNSEPIED
jgi:AbiV family abortive infection protein